MPLIFRDDNSPEYRIRGRVRNRYERHAIERRKLLSAWGTIALDDPGGYIQTIAGSIQPIPRGPIRDFKVVVPYDYPYESPRSYSVNWLISGPHCYGDNEMCLWRDNEWTPRYTLAYAVGKTYVWIHKYEEYLRSGVWPGRQQIH